MFGLLPKNFEFYDCFAGAVENAMRGSCFEEHLSHSL
jgi:hypothetical protein